MRLPIRLASVFVLAAMLLAIAWMVNGARLSSSEQIGNRIRLGRQLHLQAIDFSSAARTLLIFSSSSCQYCVDSLGFYRSLLTETSSMPDATPIVMLSAEPIETFRLFVKRNRMNPSQIVSMNPSELNVRIVPTILIVDRSGRVTRVWVGQESKATQSAILSAIRRTQY
jgi:hypothetical protein